MEKETDHINGTLDDGDQRDVDPIDGMDEQAAAKEKLTADPNKIKFTSINLVDGKNGEAKVDIHIVQTSIGMGKEELMKYANEPFWVRLRLFLFILFWVGWIAMLVGAVVIILVAPRCPPAPRLEWYQKTSMYQVNVADFKDSDGNGVGDLQGLLSKLDYFSEINVKTLLLGALYAMAPGTNGILNHTDIDIKFGTMADMDQLLAEAKKRDLKVILDFIPNQSSNHHAWFQASVDGEKDYKDFYVWADASSSGPPSNWLSVTGGSAWELDTTRNQYYLHTYGKDEPDLNLRNEVVQEKLKDVLRFWLDRGVDGFKVKGASHLVEDEVLKDEPLGTETRVANPNYGDQDHAFTVDQPENLILFADWKELLNNYSASTGSDKILMAELSGGINTTLKYYGNGTNTLVEFPINLSLNDLTAISTPLQLKHVLNYWLDALQNFGWPNWMIGHKGTKRLADRVGSELLDGFHMVYILARGTPITYFGDEIGMTKKGFMPWTNESSDASSQTTSVEAQILDVKSHLKVFGHLVELRNQPAINFGFTEYPVVTEEVFSMIRVRKGSPAYLVVINMSTNSTVVDFSVSKTLPETGRVEIRSQNIDSGPLFQGEHPKLKLNNIPLGPKESAVFSFVPQFED